MTTEETPGGITPAQTVGPFFAYVLTPQDYATRPIVSADLVTPDAAGERIRIEGRVLDGDDEPVVDAMLEIWQADSEGRHVAPGRNAAFPGFGRTDVDANGAFAFSTVKPGRVAGPGGSLQAPHVNLTIFARGLLRHLFTRVYFADEPSNADDAILALVPTERRATLIASRQDRGGLAVYTVDIGLQGVGETVFFES